MNRPLYIIAAVLACILLVTVFWKPTVSADRLIKLALTAESEEVQVQATQQLSQLGDSGIHGLRRVFKESKNDEVVAVSIMGLSRHRDYPSMLPIIAKLEDPAENVRYAASKAVTRLLGRDHRFPVRGTQEEQAKFKKTIEKDWEQYYGSELFKYNERRFDLPDQGEMP